MKPFRSETKIYITIVVVSLILGFLISKISYSGEKNIFLCDKSGNIIGHTNTNIIKDGLIVDEWRGTFKQRKEVNPWTRRKF